MLIEYWVFALVVAGIFVLALISIVGWIFEGEKHEAQVRENKALREENKRLAEKIAHRNALENIKVANEYYNNKEK